MCVCVCVCVCVYVYIHCLFSILIKKGIQAIIVRIIMNMYENQESCVTWNGMYGDF